MFIIMVSRDANECMIVGLFSGGESGGEGALPAEEEEGAYGHGG